MTQDYKVLTVFCATTTVLKKKRKKFGSLKEMFGIQTKIQTFPCSKTVVRQRPVLLIEIVF